MGGLATHGFHHYRTRNNMKILGLIVLGLLCSLVSAAIPLYLGNRKFEQSCSPGPSSTAFCEEIFKDDDKDVPVLGVEGEHYVFVDLLLPGNDGRCSANRFDKHSARTLCDTKRAKCDGGHCNKCGAAWEGHDEEIAKQIVDELDGNVEGKKTIKYLRCKAENAGQLHYFESRKSFLVMMDQENLPISAAFLSRSRGGQPGLRRRLGRKPSDYIPRRSDIFHPRINQIFRETKKQS